MPEGFEQRSRRPEFLLRSCNIHVTRQRKRIFKSLNPDAKCSIEITKIAALAVSRPPKSIIIFFPGLDLLMLVKLEKGGSCG